MHKTVAGTYITNKIGLKNMFNATSKKFELIDATIKVYDDICFMFFMNKPSLKTETLFDSIHSHLNSFGSWTHEYAYTSVYDLDENYLRVYLNKLGFDYDKG